MLVSHFHIMTRLIGSVDTKFAYQKLDKYFGIVHASLHIKIRKHGENIKMNINRICSTTFRTKLKQNIEFCNTFNSSKHIDNYRCDTHALQTESYKTNFHLSLLSIYRYWNFYKNIWDCHSFTKNIEHLVVKLSDFFWYRRYLIMTRSVHRLRAGPPIRFEYFDYRYCIGADGALYRWCLKMICIRIRLSHRRSVIAQFLSHAKNTFDRILRLVK